MKTKDYTLKILVKQSPKEVFEAINKVRGWWQGEFDGSSNKLNDEFSYRMADIHFSKQKVVELIPNEKIVWLVTESKLNFIDHKNEWTGTKIIFEISQINNKTQIKFTHQGLVPQVECYDACANAWDMLVKESLLSLITSGKGKKVF
ncbi:MAG TPA: SRPBCC domain-containing protein [Bacteroidia bacterium]|nr:SRPBCC domain-containing protein [Bacteroidia bacterium]